MRKFAAGLAIGAVASHIWNSYVIGWALRVGKIVEIPDGMAMTHVHDNDFRLVPND